MRQVAARSRAHGPPLRRFVAPVAGTRKPHRAVREGLFGIFQSNFRATRPYRTGRDGHSPGVGGRAMPEISAFSHRNEVRMSFSRIIRCVGWAGQCARCAIRRVVVPRSQCTHALGLQPPLRFLVCSSAQYSRSLECPRLTARRERGLCGDGAALPYAAPSPRPWERRATPGWPLRCAGSMMQVMLCLSCRERRYARCTVK